MYTYLTSDLVISSKAEIIHRKQIEEKNRLVLDNVKRESLSTQHPFQVDTKQKVRHVRIPSNYNEMSISEALAELEANAQDNHKLLGKLAVYVTVGSIKSHVVVFKKNKDSEIMKPILGRRFGNQKLAEKFMTFLKSRAEYEDKDLVTVSGDDPTTKHEIVKSLECLFHIAKAKDAAIVIPDYSTLSPNSKLIEDALNNVDFKGPVVSVSCDDQVASCEETAKMQYQFGNTYHPRGILFARTTHSFQLCESPGVKHTDLYSTLGARLVAAISQPASRQSSTQQSKDQQPIDEEDNLDSDEDGKAYKANTKADGHSCCRHNAVFVVAGGGKVALRHLEQAVLVGIPVVVLEGSGRLCDYLPKLWVRRFATGFDAVKESNRFCEEIGFQETNDGTLGRQLRQVGRENHLRSTRAVAHIC